MRNGRMTHGPWRGDGAVILGTTHRDEPQFIGVGDPRSAAKLLAKVRNELPGAKRASLPRGWLDHVDPPHALSYKSAWAWFWTTTRPAPSDAESNAEWLGEADTDAIHELLTAASPDTSTWPSDDRARRWAGIRAEDGSLAAVLADTSRAPEVDNISSVATDPQRRGNGHGGALTAWATRQFLNEGAEIVTLGMYADNDVARRMYERIGYTCSHQFTSVLFEAPA
jgi:GNAT superfamily N-acetyltransferase